MVRQQRSAGILLFRLQPDGLQVLLGHPGGPFWRNKHNGAWSIPKGLVESGEDERAAALREFCEETGTQLDDSRMVALGEATQRSGKTVVAWAIAGDLDVATLVSNPVRLEWPRGSGRTVEFPEIDKIRWCHLDEARALINSGQVPFLDRLQDLLNHTE